MRWWPPSLKNEACLEAYEYFDKNIRPLPKNAEGEFDTSTGLFMDNDIDAFRHAYVSGRFTHEYGADVAELFGNLNEVITFGSNTIDDGKAKNMDLWNNAVGRKYGSKIRKRETLLKALHKALRSGEMILDLKDERQYRPSRVHTIKPNKSVVVLEQSESGRNELFYDLATHKKMTRHQFVLAIEQRKYPGYRIINSHGLPTPVSRPDGTTNNNLG
jgi:hypothetical protein